MAALYDKGDKDYAAPTLHNIRITLNSKNHLVLQQTCQQLVERAKGKDIIAKGPTPMPTKTLIVKTRKSPCGNGTETYEGWEMKIHKRLVDLIAPTELVKQIVVSIPKIVDVEVTVSA